MGLSEYYTYQSDDWIVKWYVTAEAKNNQHSYVLEDKYFWRSACDLYKYSCSTQTMLFLLIDIMTFMHSPKYYKMELHVRY